MSILRKNIDEHPYTGIRGANGYLKVKEKGSYIDKFFDGTPDFEQVEHITQGKIYKVIKIEGLGDVEDITIINDIGEEDTLADYFFEEIQEGNYDYQ